MMIFRAVPAEQHGAVGVGRGVDVVEDPVKPGPVAFERGRVVAGSAVFPLKTLGRPAVLARAVCGGWDLPCHYFTEDFVEITHPIYDTTYLWGSSESRRPS